MTAECSIIRGWGTPMRVAMLALAILGLLAPARAQSEMTNAEILDLKLSILRCWKPADKTTKIEAHLKYDPDGTLANPTYFLNPQKTPAYVNARQAAIDALVKCQPIKVPPGKYSEWKEIVLIFDPADALPPQGTVTAAKPAPASIAPLEGLWAGSDQDCRMGSGADQVEGDWLYIGRGAVFFYQVSCRIGSVNAVKNRFDIKARCMGLGIEPGDEAYAPRINLLNPDTIQVVLGSSTSTKKLCGKAEPGWVADAKVP